ncbi:MAG: transglutaminase domain-containing protein [Deltaproteobacteria bacterium]|nr:transglutaminase domain-containing protein [Deltaproteobacteria bacterium]
MPFEMVERYISLLFSLSWILLISFKVNPVLVLTVASGLVTVFFLKKAGYFIWILPFLVLPVTGLNILWDPVTVGCLASGVVIIILGSFRKSFRTQFIFMLVLFSSTLIFFPSIEHNAPIIVSESLFFYFFFIITQLLLLRHDIENHHIIKHRVGRESRMVEVDRLLKSHKVLDPFLRIYIAVFSAVLLVTALIILAIFIPLSSEMKFRKTQHGNDFGNVFNLNSYGNLSLPKTTFFKIETEEIEHKRMYFQAKIMAEYNDGYWYQHRHKSSELKVHHSKIPQEYKKIVIHNLKKFPMVIFPITSEFISLENKIYILPPSGYFMKTVKDSYTIYSRENTPVFLETKKPAELSQKISPVITKLANEMRSLPKNLGKDLEKLKIFFNDFSYCDKCHPSAKQNDPVEYFLTKSRKGACGHFASATVLLLRAMGYQADLILGFSVETKGNNQFSISGENAHSWVRVFDTQKGWILFDPTVSRRSQTITTDYNLNSVIIFTAIFLIFFTFVTIIFLKFFSLRKRIITEKAPHHEVHEKKISITSFEASLIFHDIASNRIFEKYPRNPGESAVNYAKRVRDAGHESAGILITASGLANDILFSDIDLASRQLLLKHLKEISLNLP